MQSHLGLSQLHVVAGSNPIFRWPHGGSRDLSNLPQIQDRGHNLECRRGQVLLVYTLVGTPVIEAEVHTGCMERGSTGPVSTRWLGTQRAVHLWTILLTKTRCCVFL